MKKNGFAIILVLATLVLLALLAYIYIKLALIDRNIARNYVDNKRARLIAQSGVDYAIGRLDNSGWFTDSAWVYKDDLNPSYATDALTINGQLKGYSQAIGSTYGQNKDLFVLKMIDTQSQININDGLGNPRVTNNTKRILNILGEVAGIVEAKIGGKLGDVLIGNDGINRPAQGYMSKQEILGKLNNDQEEFRKIKDLTTTHAWQDSNVANPVPLSSRYRSGLVYAPELALPESFDHSFYGTDELNAQWIEIVSRSPVNINQADERVLIALIKDLQGIFCSDRRRNAPTDISSGLQLDYSPTSTVKSSQMGFLYSTEAITNAQAIAAEIKKCRDNDPAYAGQWFRGPFKTWRQFNAFVDNLVPRTATEDLDPTKIIRDSRSPVFLEYDSTDVLVQSDIALGIALRIAHQAKADVLKANFNPNLHLNELNPDANIKTHVDKTDLIVNSTEFCFTPMGIFEIASEGMIVKEKGTDNVIIANSRLQAVVKLYDVYRETNQRQFLAGQLPLPDPALNTNNNNVLEIGPEPSHIDATIAAENEYSGYISLPTVSTAISAALYGTFTSGLSTDTNTTNSNLANTGGAYPYNATYRPARSYRGTAGTTYAPANLRIDGAYLERSRRLAYSLQTGTPDDVAFCYWVKPWFYPEQTGKPRAYLNMTRGISASTKSSTKQLSYSQKLIFANHTPPDHVFCLFEYEITIEKEVTSTLYNSGTGFFANYYFPAQGNEIASPYYMNCLALCFSGYGDPSTSSSSGYNEWSETYMVKCPQNTKGFSAAKRTNTYMETTYYKDTSYKLGFIGKMTEVLNHNYHGDSQPTYFKSGQWVHIAGRRDSTAQPYLVINGSLSNILTSTMPDSQASLTTVVSPSGTLYIGESGLDTARNWSSDSTIDELFYDTSFSSATGIYYNSRYFRTGINPSSFMSQSLNLKRKESSPSLSSIIQTPDGSTGASSTLPSNRMRILGVSWTWFAEGTDTTGRAILKNHRNPSDAANNLTTTYIYPVVKVKFIIDGSEQPQKYDDDGLSGVYLDVTGSTTIKYKVILELPGMPADAVLLYTPIFDDITIYYTGGVTFLSYSYYDV